MPDSSELKEYEPTARPELLDVVKIDGRWAQVKAGGDHVTYLDDGTTELKNWDEYKVTTDFMSRSIALLEKQGLIDFTDQELANVHWGSEQELNPELKKQVRVFAEYIKK